MADTQDSLLTVKVTQTYCITTALFTSRPYAKVIVFLIKITNSIHSRAKQHRTFRVLFEELSANYGDLLHRNPMALQGTNFALFLFFFHFWVKSDFIQSRGDDTSLLEDTD